MSTRRIIDLTVDIGRAAVIGEGNRTLNENDIWLFRGDGNLLRFTFRYTEDDGQTWQSFAIPSDAELKFGIKDQGDYTGQFLVYSGNSEWNVEGDWGDANRSQGKCCVRVDCNTEALTNLLESGSEATGVAEVQMHPPGEDTVTLVQFNVGLRPDVIRGDEGEPAPTTPPYATTDYVDAAVGAYFERDENGDLWIVDNGVRKIKVS